MAQQVFVLEKGEYSGAWIDGIFSTLEKAKEAAGPTKREWKEDGYGRDSWFLKTTPTQSPVAIHAFWLDNETPEP